MEELVRRLNKIEGQVRGVRKMIEENRDCADVLTQLAAVRMGIHRVSILIMADYFSACVARDMDEAQEAEEALRRAARIMSKYL